MSVVRITVAIDADNVDKKSEPGAVRTGSTLNSKWTHMPTQKRALTTVAGKSEPGAVATGPTLNSKRTHMPT